MDLVPGDRIAILSTSFCPDCGDDVHVLAYDAATGVTKIDRSRQPNDNDASLMFYHWGAEKSTKDDYSVDMRGEVILLTRNIKIVGEDIESWGAQVVTSDTVEFDSEGEMITRTGESHIDSVEFFNCS